MHRLDDLAAVDALQVSRAYQDGTIEWCLEYWDDRGEADLDAETPDEQSAVDRAVEEFGIKPEEWRSGPQPWGKPER